MKKLFLPVIVIAVITTGFTVRSKKQFIPPGTVQINDTLFADACEISNFSWQEYELSMATVYGKNSKEHLAALPDTLVWRDNLSYNEPYVQYYYRHPAYKDYPVVGISYEQAIAYCKWRTEMARTVLSAKRDFIHQNFEYRLPTKAEWERLAESSAACVNNEGKNEKGIYRLNCRLPIDDLKNHKSDNADVTAPVQSYWKNSLGLYNMVGNVAEMVSEKGICKGGGWRHVLEECRVGKDREYTKPTAWLGFRCICVVKKSKEC